MPKRSAKASAALKREAAKRGLVDSGMAKTDDLTRVGSDGEDPDHSDNGDAIFACTFHSGDTHGSLWHLQTPCNDPPLQIYAATAGAPMEQVDSSEMDTGIMSSEPPQELRVSFVISS